MGELDQQFAGSQIKKLELNDNSSLHGNNSAADYFFAAFLAAHSAFILAEILALADALILRLPLPFLPAGFAVEALPLILAQRNLAAAEILALAAALILNFRFPGAGPAAEVTVEPSR